MHWKPRLPRHKSFTAHFANFPRRTQERHGQVSKKPPVYGSGKYLYPCALAAFGLPHAMPTQSLSSYHAVSLDYSASVTVASRAIAPTKTVSSTAVPLQPDPNVLIQWLRVGRQRHRSGYQQSADLNLVYHHKPR